MCFECDMMSSGFVACFFLFFPLPILQHVGLMRRVRLQSKSVSSGGWVLLKSHKPRLRYERWRSHRATFIPSISTGDRPPKLIRNCSVFMKMLRTSCPSPTLIETRASLEGCSTIQELHELLRLCLFFLKQVDRGGKREPLSERAIVTRTHL